MSSQQVGSRRTPLSLSGGPTAKAQQPTGSSAANGNGGAAANSAKLSQKSEQTASERREASVASRDLKKQQHAEAKRATAAEEKKSQNGVAKSNGNGHGSNSSSNSKEKVQNGSNSGNATANQKEKSERVGKQKDGSGREETKSNDPLDDKKLKKDVKIMLINERVHDERKNDKEAKSSKHEAVEQETAVKERKSELIAKTTDAAQSTEAPPTNVEEKKSANKTDSEQAIAVAADVSMNSERADSQTPTKATVKHLRISVGKSPTPKATVEAPATPTVPVGTTDTAATTPKTKKHVEETREEEDNVIVIDDDDMETLTVDASPIKAQPVIAGVTMIANNPGATSTPGRIFQNKPQVLQVHTNTRNNSPAIGAFERKDYLRPFSQISGRRSIRPISEYTPSKFQSNVPYRDSYRRINTELDVTSTTNTSMNVTVGSEVPNSSSFSFSFFGRGRKRERTPPSTVTSSQSSTELHTEVDISPPKRVRLDKSGFFSGFIYSPMTLLRSAFTKASIQPNTTPFKERLEQTPPIDDVEVQNVSGIVIEEDVAVASRKSTDSANDDDITVANEAGLETPKKGGSPDKDAEIENGTNAAAAVASDEQQSDENDANVSNCGANISNLDDSNTDDIKITETVDDKKSQRCVIM